MIGLRTFLLENLVFPIGDSVLGSNFMASLKRWRKLQWESAGVLSNLQLENLRKLLTYATEKNKYYNSLAIPHDDDPIKWLKSFPVLYKNTIRANSSSIVAKTENLVREVSSGSSGVQGEVFMTRREQSQSQAAQTLFWEWAGFKLGSPMLQLGMTLKRTRVKRLKDLILRTDYQQAFNIVDQVAVKALQRSSKNDRFFGGYASGLYAYACIAEANGIKNVRFQSVISWGDKMFLQYRRKLESVFDTKVFDVYGTTEGLSIAGQCEAGNFHVLSPHVYLELLDKDGREVAPGELGFVVATRLDAFAMPLIRYYLGDLAVAAPPEQNCSCGRQFPMLKQIIGRDTDIVRTRSGKYLIVHFFTGIFEHYHQILQFQVIQKELDSITVNYIADPTTFGQGILDDLQATINSKLGEKLDVRFERVDEIPASPSGKPQIIKSFLEKPDLK